MCKKWKCHTLYYNMAFSIMSLKLLFKILKYLVLYYKFAFSNTIIRQFSKDEDKKLQV